MKDGYKNINSEFSPQVMSEKLRYTLLLNIAYHQLPKKMRHYFLLEEKELNIFSKIFKFFKFYKVIIVKMWHKNNVFKIFAIGRSLFNLLPSR